MEVHRKTKYLVHHLGKLEVCEAILLKPIDVLTQA